MNYSLGSVFILFIVMCENTVQGISCSECNPPKFQGQPLYLPFCLNGETYNNLCDALCSVSKDPLSLESYKPTKGSCENCELNCSNIFRPCSKVSDSNISTVFPNKCHAKCSGMEYEDCKDLLNASVIPGKTKLPVLPISKASPQVLQNLKSF